MLDGRKTFRPVTVVGDPELRYYRATVVIYCSTVTDRP